MVQANHDRRVAAELSALGHPTRLRMMRVACRSEDPVRSAADASRLLGEPLSLVSYHARILRQAGLIEVVELIRCRGAVKQRYEPTARGRELVTLLAASRP